MSIKLKDISKSYKTPEGSVQILDEINLDFEEGLTHSITGPSGCGKSTLLNIIGTIDEPDSGKVIYGFRDFSSEFPGDRNPEKLRNTHIGFIFQDHLLMPEFSVFENIILPAIIKGTAKEEYNKKAYELAEVCGIGNILSKNPTKISGGESQRAAVARALINDPELILADEPTGNLDFENSKKVFDLLSSLVKKQAATLLLVTHSDDLAKLTDHSYTLKDKKLSKSF
ncbi:MAG: ABC transporter ATP-binding protein [Candidatus Kapaibacteriales bacterium]